MSVNRGKQFEAKFKTDFSKIPGATLDRLQDQLSGYRGSNNICDFICYLYPNIFYIELKTTNANTFPFSSLTQYEDLLPKVGIPGVRVGVVIWFVQHDRILYVPISTIHQMKDNGLKSVNIRKIDDEEIYKYVEIPSIKRRVFFDSDYTVLQKLDEGD